MSAGGWEIDPAMLPGRAHVFESPDGRHAVVVHGIDECGVGKEAGHVAVLRKTATGHPFRESHAVEVVFRPRDVYTWYLGEQTIRFDAAGRTATFDEFRNQRSNGRWPPPRTRTIDLERACFVDET